MTIGDFFDFSETEYARRISFYLTDRLRNQEVVKTRQQAAAMCSIGTGVAGAIPSGGGTLLLSAYGSRRLYVAQAKLKLIRAELTKRGVALHELQKRDVLIPFAASIVGMGVGVGLEDAATAVTNTVPMAAGLPSGSSVTQALATNSGDTISGAAHGIAQQAREMGHAILDANNGIPAAQDLAMQTTWVSATSAQEAVGFHTGMGAMQATEKGVASLASKVLATQGMEAMCGQASKRKSAPRDVKSKRKSTPQDVKPKRKSAPQHVKSVAGQGNSTRPTDSWTSVSTSIALPSGLHHYTSLLLAIVMVCLLYCVTYFYRYSLNNAITE